MRKSKKLIRGEVWARAHSEAALHHRLGEFSLASYSDYGAGRSLTSQAYCDKCKLWVTVTSYPKSYGTSTHGPAFYLPCRGLDKP